MKGITHTKYRPNGAEIGEERKETRGLIHILVRAEVLIVGKADPAIAVNCHLCVASKIRAAMMREYQPMKRASRVILYLYNKIALCETNNQENHAILEE